MNKCRLIVIAILALTVNISLASSNYSYKSESQIVDANQNYQQSLKYPKNQILRGNVIMVPAGASINAILSTPLSSQTMTAGQTVTMYLNEDYYYDGKLIAESGSTIYGTVIEASKAKRAGINGKLCVRFNQIFTPYGTQIPISAVIKTNDYTGVLQGGAKLDVAKEYTKDLAAGSAAGALSGLVFGALAGGDVGRGAALGTAVGAGGGLVKSVWDKGNDVEIPRDALVELVLTQPITVSSSQYYQEN